MEPERRKSHSPVLTTLRAAQTAALGGSEHKELHGLRDKRLALLHHPMFFPQCGWNQLKSLKTKCMERKTENTDQSWVKGRNSTFYLRFTEKVSMFPLGGIS